MDRRDLLGLKTVAAGGGGKAAATGSYLRLPTVTGNARRADGRLGIMTVETGVDTPNEALRARVQQSAPRLRAAYAQVIGDTARGLLPGAAPDVERMVAQLQAATDRAVGRRGARLLIGTVMVV